MFKLKAVAAVSILSVLTFVLAESLHSQIAAPTAAPTTAPAKTPASKQAFAFSDRFDKKEFKNADGKTLPYRLLKPAKADPKTKYPLVIFLHGSGECGSNNVSQLGLGVSNLFGCDETMSKYPSYVVVPQCPARAAWRGETLALTVGLIEQLQKDYSIDPGRIYIIGLSMGGFGVWQALAEYPDLFAAGVPICGGGDPAWAQKFAKVPMWAFHGEKDLIVRVDFSRSMIKAMKEAGGDPKYTEYPGVGHFSWNNAFAEPNLLEWMFAQKRGTAASKPASQPASAPTQRT